MIKILETKQLNSSIIKKICLLKNQEWDYGLKSNLKWFENNVYDDDINFLFFYNSKLIAYNCLRKRNFYDPDKNIKKKKIYIFDSFIVNKNFRNRGVAKKLLLNNNLYLKKHRLISFLLCKDKMKSFYKKLGWQAMKLKNINIINHKTKLNLMSFNIKIASPNLLIYF